jgi:hypothetical protein
LTDGHLNRKINDLKSDFLSESYPGPNAFSCPQMSNDEPGALAAEFRGNRPEAQKTELSFVTGQECSVHWQALSAQRGGFLQSCSEGRMLAAGGYIPLKKDTKRDD